MLLYPAAIRCNGSKFDPVYAAFRPALTLIHNVDLLKAVSQPLVAQSQSSFTRKWFDARQWSLSCWVFVGRCTGCRQFCLVIVSTLNEICWLWREKRSSSYFVGSPTVGSNLEKMTKNFFLNSNAMHATGFIWLTIYDVKMSWSHRKVLVVCMQRIFKCFSYDTFPVVMKKSSSFSSALAQAAQL